MESLKYLHSKLVIIIADIVDREPDCIQIAHFGAELELCLNYCITIIMEFAFKVECLNFWLRPRMFGFILFL